MTAARTLTEEISPEAPDSLDSARAASSGYNLNGQKLGRKGRDTRDRILAAAADLITNEPETPISLSAVARRASLGMTSLYNYYSDLTELILAVLEPVMATAEDQYVGMLREYWPDDDLFDRCERFVDGLYAFWHQNARVLHLRNNMSDAHDLRIMQHRVKSTQPVIRLLIAQMDGNADRADTPATAMATVLMTGIERSITVNTDHYVRTLFGAPPLRSTEHYLWPAARIMMLAIRDARAQMRDFAALSK